MPRRKKAHAVPQVEQAIETFKDKIIQDLGLSKPPGDYWGGIPSSQCGLIGGMMVKRMIEAAERSLVEQGIAAAQAGFRQELMRGH
ncbi:MAG TPA: alpha/beta-type small acid-soluble spore protein [Firmicutes bacterium]|nr:alpha/beta-type small acid-soluble spore protein [Bacillota bacterium]